MSAELSEPVQRKGVICVVQPKTDQQNEIFKVLEKSGNGSKI